MANADDKIELKGSARAYGRSLSDFWLDGEEGKLHPAEEKLLECVMRGRICKIEEGRPEEKTLENLVRVGFVRFLALGGDAAVPVHEQGVCLDGAWIADEDAGKGKAMMSFQGAILPALLHIMNCKIDGLLNLLDAEIKTLDLTGSEVSMIIGDGAKFVGGVFFRNGFRAIDEVRFVGAKITGDLDCLNGTFEGTGDALTCDRSEINGNVLLSDGFQAVGVVRLMGARIEGNLVCSGGKFGGKGESIQLQDVCIGRTWFWRKVVACSGKIELAVAHVGTICDDRASWEKVIELSLEGFTYDRFGGDQAHKSVDFWKSWLSKQPQSQRTIDFKPQPFEQLAKVLAEQGYEEDAKEIRIHKRQLQREARFKYQSGGISDGRRYLIWVWDRFLDIAVGYGYRPIRALAMLGCLWLFGAGVYFGAAQVGVMTPTHPLVYQSKTIPDYCRENWVYWVSPIFGPELPVAEIQRRRTECAAAMPSEYSGFNALMYSLDVVIPILDLRQQTDWAPRVVHADGTTWRLGQVVRIWEWFSIGAGWVFSLLLAASVGGVIRRD